MHLGTESLDVSQRSEHHSSFQMSFAANNSTHFLLILFVSLDLLEVSFLTTISAVLRCSS